MAYKTIMVHLNNERRAGELLAHAAGLGEAFASHIIGVCVVPGDRRSPAVPAPFAAELTVAHDGELHEEQKRIRLIFDLAVARSPCDSEWRLVTCARQPVADVVVAEAKAADLVIASQADPDWGFSAMIDCPDRLAIEVGRPVLVIPNQGSSRPIPRTAVVAWSGRREGVRATFDALPLLKLAERIEVVAIKDKLVPPCGSLPGGDEIATTLNRHGIKAGLRSLDAREDYAAQALCTLASDLAADVIVMGAYGHTRATGFVLGDVTRHVLKNMPVPVLFSH
jgi:nucleotide-binding universal stress UspA family protein